MLFFRSEERVREWCAAHGYLMRPLVTMDQLWTLATTWYSTRLQENSRRPQPDEMRSIFAGLGLVGGLLGSAVGQFRLTDPLAQNCDLQIQRRGLKVQQTAIPQVTVFALFRYNDSTIHVSTSQRGKC